MSVLRPHPRKTVPPTCVPSPLPMAASRTPLCSGHLHLCYFHAQKEAESLAAQQVGKAIARFLPVKLLTACDLGAAMARLFCAVAHKVRSSPKSPPLSAISPRPCSNPSP